MLERAKIPEEILKYKNVNGYSTFLMPKEKDGVLDETQEVIRIYVEKKQPLSELYESWVLPQAIDDIPIDIFEIFPVYAYLNPIPHDGRRDVVKPLMSGISVGHVTITAGTLGHMAQYTDGELYATSNAHVLTPDPSFEAGTFSENRIVQPGIYDQGQPATDVVGEYFWHERIYSGTQVSKCKTANLVQDFLNGIASALDRKSRFSTYVSGINNQDFAAFKLADGIDYDMTKTFDFDISDYLLCARLFAGSTATSILCKTKYQAQAGFIPQVPAIDEPIYASTVRKSGRTTGDSSAKVIDTSASIKVNYGNFTAIISDVVVTNDMSAGGDSGSDIWIHADDTGTNPS